MGVIGDILQKHKDEQHEIVENENKEIVKLFHRCWGNSTDASEYKKALWIELQRLLRKRGFDV